MPEQDYIGPLPAELFFYIFALLECVDLRSCSYASQSLRAIVHAMDHYHLTSRLRIHTYDGYCLQHYAKFFLAAMQGLSATTIPIALELAFGSPENAADVSYLQYRPPHLEQNIEDIVNNACAALTNVCVVALDIRVKDIRLFSDIVPILQATAPRLRRILITSEQLNPTLASTSMDPRAELPAHSFGASLNLREVRLQNIALPVFPIPAFAQTTFVEFQDVNINCIPTIIQHFPQMERLTLVAPAIDLAPNLFQTFPPLQFPTTFRQLDITADPSGNSSMAIGLKLMVPPTFQTLILRGAHPVAVLPFIQHFLPGLEYLEALVAENEATRRFADRVNLTLAHQVFAQTGHTQRVQLILSDPSAHEWTAAKGSSAVCRAQVARITGVYFASQRPLTQLCAAWEMLLSPE